MCSVIHKHRILYTKEFKSFIVVQSTIKIVHLGVVFLKFRCTPFAWVLHISGSRIVSVLEVFMTFFPGITVEPLSNFRNGWI